MPLLGPDGQPVSLPHCLDAQQLADFPPMSLEGLAELRSVTEEALAGGISPQNTIAIPLAAVAQLLRSLEGATEIILQQDSAAPPWMEHWLAHELAPPSPATARVTYWQDGTLQVEVWHHPDNGEPRLGVLGHGTTIYEAYRDARPIEPVTLLQLDAQGKLDPAPRQERKKGF